MLLAVHLHQQHARRLNIPPAEAGQSVLGHAVQLIEAGEMRVTVKNQPRVHLLQHLVRRILAQAVVFLPELVVVDLAVDRCRTDLVRVAEQGKMSEQDRPRVSPVLDWGAISAPALAATAQALQR